MPAYLFIKIIIYNKYFKNKRLKILCIAFININNNYIIKELILIKEAVFII